MRQDPEALPHRPESAPDNPDTSARKGSPRQFSRRKFVRTAGGVLIATGFGASCGDNAAGPVDTGSLRVVISGLSEVDSGRNGGEVTLTALEVEDFDPQKETLPASGDTGELAGFPVGRYRLEYEPPTGHVLATGESASQDIEVTIDTLTTVEWSVDIIVNATCAVSGTITSSATEGGVVGGGLSIILTLTGDEWAGSVGANNSFTTDLLNGITSAQSGAAGWNAVVKPGLSYQHVTRTSDTVLTIELPAFSGYAINGDESVSVTVPASALALSIGPVTATPGFTISDASSNCLITGTLRTSASEAGVIAGGLTMRLTLSGEQWVATVGDDNAITTALLNGIDSAQSETNGWNAVVKPILSHTNVVRTSNTVVTLTLPAAAGYAVSGPETISVVVPASALAAATSSLQANPAITIPNTAETCSISGTITQDVVESDIVAGGLSLVLTLNGDQWGTTVGWNNAVTTALINGISSAQSQTNGWNNVVRANLSHDDVVRTSDTVVTITLPAFADYLITAEETVTVTVPASALQASSTEIGATPAISISNLGEGCILTGTMTTPWEEGIVNGGLTLILTLTGDEWVATVGQDNSITDSLINGMSATQSEATGWNAVVRAGLSHANVVRTSDTVVTVTLPGFPGYAISADENLTITVPPSALANSASSIVASPSVTIPNTDEQCVVTGTIMSAATESGIVSGGLTIVLTLFGAQWEAAVGGNNSVTTALIEGLDSNQSGFTGWNAIVRAGLTHNNVVRTSNTVVTITLPPFAAYDIAAAETITCTVPASAVVGFGNPIVANPTFSIASGDFLTPDILDNADFETGWNGFQPGGAETRVTNRSYSGTYSVHDFLTYT